MLTKTMRVFLLTGGLLGGIIAPLAAQEANAEVRPDTLPGLWDECSTPDALPATIYIGAPLGLTGPISIYGIPQQQGIDIAVDEINAAGYLGDSTLEVIYEDTEGNADQAIAAMTKLVEEDGVAVVFGPTLSTEAFAADAIASDAGVPVMGVTNAAIGIPEIGDFVFRGGLPEAAVIPNTVKQAKDTLGIESVAILYGNDDDFTQSGYDVFVTALAEEGITVTGEATFARGDVDFTAQLTDLLATKPDALAVSALAAEGIQILVQARNLGFEGYVLGGNGFNSPQVIENGGAAAENLVVGAAWNIAAEDPMSAAFVATYNTRYAGNHPDQFSVQAYTVIWLYATAIRCQNSVEGEAIRAGLLAVEGLASPLGVYRFDEQREPQHPPVTQIVRDGKFMLLTEK